MPPNEADADADGYRICAGDCNDANPAIHPGAPELCNGSDDDCNAATPDEVPLASASCQLFVDKLTYSATDVATLASRITSPSVTATVAFTSVTLVRSGP